MAQNKKPEELLIGFLKLIFENIDLKYKTV